MSERIDGPARMSVPIAPRRRGHPPHERASGMREKAWWLMRQMGRFTLDELLLTLVDADGDRSDPESNVRKYVRALERCGVVARMRHRTPGQSPKSNGHIVFRLARDLGRLAPVWRGAQGAVWDPNARAVIPPVSAAGAVTTPQPTASEEP